MRAVITSFHNYAPMHPHTYFDVLFDHYMANFNRYWRGEVDHLYLLDSNWDIPEIKDEKVTVVKTDPNDRYYDAYKKFLPSVQEDLVGFLDNDMVIYREGAIDGPFRILEKRDIDVCSIFDTIGEFETDKMDGKNKLCPYYFFTKKELLMNYLDVEWGPDMPYCETLGHLTEAMLKEGLRFLEYEEDKEEATKDLGYFHVRAGSTVPWLLTTREYGDRKTYNDYLRNQPESELLRHVKWYEIMGGDASVIKEDLEKNHS